MTSTRAINAAADVICRAMQQGRTLPSAFAYALDSAGLLQSPESAAELLALRARVAELEAAAGDGSTRPVDEDPIAYALTPEALHASSGAVIEIPARAEDVSRQVQELRGLLSRQRAAAEDPHDDPVGLHHDYRTGRDLPEVTP